MPSYKRPGTYASEFLTPSQPPIGGETSFATFIGAHHRGPTEATLISSWTEFVSIYGGFPPVGGTVSELAHAVYQYMSNGGRQAYIVRVLGSGAAVSSLTLMDRAGTPLATLRVDALNAGVWGNDLRIDIVDRPAAGRFDLIVKFGGTTDNFIVERWLDVSMNNTDPRYLVSLINSPTAGSAYIRVTDLNSATAAPNDTPSVLTGGVLAAGANGSAPSSSEIQAVTSTGGVLDVIEAPLTINIPGNSTSAVIQAALTYAETVGNHFVVIDPPAGQTPSEAVTYAAGYSATSYGAVYYPWVHVPDASTNQPGATRLQPPGPLVVGEYTETDATRGPWKAPAGLSARLTNVIALERKLNNTDLDVLNVGHVNALRQPPGAGTVIMGARTLKKSQADMYVNVRRSINYIKDALLKGTRFAIFENNDQILWNLLTTQVTRFLNGVWQSGGLRGATPDQAFYVKCDGELNTPQVIASGEIHIEIGLAFQFPAEFVVIRIGQWESGQTASDSA